MAVDKITIFNRMFIVIIKRAGRRCGFALYYGSVYIGGESFAVSCGLSSRYLA